MESLIENLGVWGYLLIWGIIFAESGLLIGFFLPGDTLLFSAGIIAHAGALNIVILIVGCAIAAIVGDNVGYWMGHRYGRKLFDQKESWLFKQEYLDRTTEFYARYGRVTIILARFVAIVRTFAPIVAGVSGMHYPIFLTYNIVGGLMWTVGVTLLGYYVGHLIPNIEQYLMLLVGGVVVITILSSLWHLYHENRKIRRR